MHDETKILWFFPIVLNEEVEESRIFSLVRLYNELAALWSWGVSTRQQIAMPKDDGCLMIPSIRTG